MKDRDSTAPSYHDPGQPRAQGVAAHGHYPPDTARCASEVLSIVAYITASDGPLQTAPGPQERLSPWHERLLRKAAERLGVIDDFMRGRVAFLVTGRDRGYYVPEPEVELAGATLDACRTATPVVEALLAGRLPTIHEYEAMGRTALALHPALDAVRELDAPPRRS
jgi:hypothetical protein